MDQQVKAKHPGGRPPKTIKDSLPENWKELILNMCAQGFSEVEIRAALSMNGKKFSHTLWYSLQAREAEFQETISIGKILCEAWWTMQARKGLRSKTFQSFLWFTNMKNRFGHSWKDKVGVEHSGHVTWEGLVNDIHGAEARNTRQMQSISHN